MTATSPNQPELLSFSALLALLDRRSRQYIYDLMRRDATFPRPIKLASDFSIAWRRSEVISWLDARPRADIITGESVVDKRSRISKSAPPVAA